MTDKLSEQNCCFKDLDEYISNNYTALVNKINKIYPDLLGLSPADIISDSYIAVKKILKNKTIANIPGYFWTVIKTNIYGIYRNNVYTEKLTDMVDPGEVDSSIRYNNIEYLYSFIIDEVEQSSEFSYIEKFIFYLYSKSIITGNKISGAHIAELSGVSINSAYNSINKIKNWIKSNKKIKNIIYSLHL